MPIEYRVIKNFLKSKTLWFNVISLVAMIIAALADADWIQDNPEYLGYVVALQSIINVVLRFFTKVPVGSQDIMKKEEGTKGTAEVMRVKN